MLRITRLAAALSVAAAGTLLTAGPAFAQTTPPPPPPALFCPTDLQNGQTITEPDGSLLFCVEALGAGAVVARTGVFLEQVIVAPGWTAVDHSSIQGGKVDVRFENPTTGGKVEVRIEPGKTEVKGN